MKPTPRIEVSPTYYGFHVTLVLRGRRLPVPTRCMHWSWEVQSAAISVANDVAAQLGNLPVYVDGEKVQP